MADPVASAIAAQLKPADSALTIALRLRIGSYHQVLALPSAGKLTLNWYGRVWSQRGTTRGPSEVLLATGTTTAHHPGRASVRLSLTQAGGALIRHEAAITITASAVFQPLPSDPILASTTFRLG